MVNTKTKLYKIISELFSVNESEIKNDIEPGEVSGWDSLGQIQLILKIEQEFNLKFSVDEMITVNNVGDILAVINKNKEEKKVTNEF